MFFGYQKKINIIINITITSIAQALIVTISWPTSSIEAQSFPVNRLKQESKENRNKQVPNIGKFQLVYNTATKYQGLQQRFQKSKIFEGVVAGLNQQKLNLPVEIPVIFTDCGEANAFYIPKKQQVIMCYELFEYMAIVFNKSGLSTEAAVQKSVSAGTFILYHEVGHALVDVLQLPITGKEEDTVDDFAAILLLDSNNNEADEIVLNASLFFSAQTDTPYWDEHSFGQQRFYNLVCLLYGKNPEQYGGIAQKVGLGESRAVRCPGEYEQKVLSWQRLLAPHSINDTDTPATNTSSPLY